MLNTGIDFLIFNLLFSLLHLPLFVANMCAATVAMLVSLYLNRRYVFRTTNGRYLEQTARFLLVTLAGIYLVQNAIMYIGINMSANVAALAYHKILLANAAKASGVIACAVWNFIWYKTWVFKRRGPRDEAESVSLPV